MLASAGVGAMMKKAMNVFVFMALDYDMTNPEPYSHPKVWAPQAWYCKVDDNAGRAFVSEQVFMADLPDDFNPVPGQVAALEEEKRKALDLYQRTLADINDKLSKLLAITN